MSKPVPYLPGDIRHDIRNTSRGEYLFVPTKLITAAFCFILATAARRYQVGVVAYAMMCTHIHLLVVDLRDEGKDSDIIEFKRFMRSTFAQFIKWYWQREQGTIFCPDSKGASIKILDFDSAEEAIAYIETNPMAAGMEKTPERMEGAVSLRKWLLEPVTFARPSVWFQKRTWAESETLQLALPNATRRRGVTPESFYEKTSKCVSAQVKAISRSRRKMRLSVRTLSFLRRLRPECGSGRSAADHSEALVAGKNPAIVAREFERIRAFRRAHARALAKLREGCRDVKFPPGTYLAVKRYGVNTTDPDGPRSSTE